MFLFFIASLEYARAHQVKNAVGYAAYQGCRRAIVPGAMASQAVASAQTILNAGKVVGATITVNPATITDATTAVTVTVSVPLASNMWTLPWFTQSVVVNRACTLTREKTN